MRENKILPERLNIGSSIPFWERKDRVEPSRRSIGEAAADFILGRRRESYEVKILEGDRVGETKAREEVKIWERGKTRKTESRVYTIGEDGEETLKFVKRAVVDLSGKKPICKEVKLEDGEGHPIKRVTTGEKPNQEVNFYKVETDFVQNDWGRPGTVELYNVFEENGKDMPIWKRRNIVYAQPDWKGKKMPKDERLGYVSYIEERYNAEKGEMSSVVIFETPNYVQGSMPSYQVKVSWHPQLEDPSVWSDEYFYEFYPNGQLKRRKERKCEWRRQLDGSWRGEEHETVFTFDKEGKQVGREDLKSLNFPTSAKRDPSVALGSYVFIKTEFPPAVKEIVDRFFESKATAN